MSVASKVASTDVHRSGPYNPHASAAARAVLEIREKPSESCSSNTRSGWHTLSRSVVVLVVCVSVAPMWGEWYDVKSLPVVPLLATRTRAAYDVNPAAETGKVGQ